MKQIDIEFLKLTTEICYIIGGFYGGGTPQDNYIEFFQDSGSNVVLNIKARMILVHDNITRLQVSAIEKLALEHGYEVDLLWDDY